MSDPFYVDLGEVKQNLSSLAVSLQKLLESTPVRQNGSAAGSSTGQSGNFDKDVVQEIVKVVGRLENQLKDLSDTFAIQTTNANKLGLSTEELTKRKEIVETQHKSFESMRENFVYLINDDPAVMRTSKERKHAVEEKGQKKKAFEPITMDVVKPSGAATSASAISSQFAIESDSDDELEVRHYRKEVAFATSTHRLDSELGPLRLTMDTRRGPFGRLSSWVTRSTRNKAIFAGSNVVVIIVTVIVLAMMIF